MTRTFTEFLERLVIEQGSQLTLAAAVKIDPAKLSRFRSDQNGLSRVEIDRLLEAGRATVAMEREIKRLETMIEHLAAMWLSEREKNAET